MEIVFLGANRQVTGSSTALDAGGLRLLVDCGLYQERPYLDRNWEPFTLPPESVDALLLTHAHLDHCGLIPRFVAAGFSGRILATEPTVDLAKITLLDSAHIQEEDAAYKKKRHAREGRRGPHPEIPLYGVEDAERSFPLFEPVAYETTVALGRGAKVRFRDAGHILGAAMLEIRIAEGSSRPRRIVFSSDIGQWDKPLVRDPSVFDRADAVVMEATYGDREHDPVGEVEDRLAEAISSAAGRGGHIIIPAFAMERAQEVLYYLARLLRKGRIPRLKVFLDSPMAVEVLGVFSRYPEYLDEEAKGFVGPGRPAFAFPELEIVRSIGESKALNTRVGPSIIVAGSGMLTGGRVKHHLMFNIERPSSTILFVGYQASHTLGRQLLEGASEVRLFGRPFKVRARIDRIEGFSAHAGRGDLRRWLSAFRERPEKLFLGHGEEKACLSFAAELEADGWPVVVPRFRDRFIL
jgi:metallo-beta-lactamase family protein